MQHSSYITGVLAVVLMYLLGVFTISRCQNGAHPPPPPGGEEGVVTRARAEWPANVVFRRCDTQARV